MTEKQDNEVAQAFTQLVQVIAQLRDPENGCPWDLEQTHLSLRKYMIEEAYEAVEAMAGSDTEHLIEELGDVLLQVVLNAQVLQDDGRGSIVDIVKTLSEKMIRRHPHVFDQGFGDATVTEVLANWEKIKADEKGNQTEESAEASLLAKVESSPLPALMHSVKIGKTVKPYKFDWSDPKEVLAVVKGELSELEQELTTGGSSEKVNAELGDLLFSIAQLARHLKLDPELAAAQGNQKFMRRFKEMERVARSRDWELTAISQEDWEELWSLVKQEER